MNYFTIKRTLFLVSSNICYEEFGKIDKFMSILEKSGVGKIIEKEKNKKKNQGNIKHNPYNLFATIIYCFAKFKGSLREIEDLSKFDIRVRYIMEEQELDHSEIGNFINRKGLFFESKEHPSPCEKRSAEHGGSLRASPQQDELGVSQLPSCHEEPATRGRQKVISE